MAKTTRVVLTCDLHGDGTEAVTTIRLDNGAARYELDLCQSHFDELTGAGRRLRPGRRTGGAGAATKAANRTAAARAGDTRAAASRPACRAPTAELDSALRRGGGGGLRSGHTPA